MAASKSVLRVVGTAQSVNVATVVVASIPMVDGKSYSVKGWFVGKAAAATPCAGEVPAASAERVAGVSALIGVGATSLVAGALAGVVVTIGVNAGANLLELRATGIALTTIDWMGRLEALEFSAS